MPVRAAEELACWLPLPPHPALVVPVFVSGAGKAIVNRVVVRGRDECLAEEDDIRVRDRDHSGEAQKTDRHITREAAPQRPTRNCSEPPNRPDGVGLCAEAWLCQSDWCHQHGTYGFTARSNICLPRGLIGLIR